MAITRREFIGAAVAGAVIAGQSKPRLPIAFSTLGCPKWEWKTILAQAAELGYAAIELRGIQEEIDLTKRPEFAGARLKQSLNDLAALNLRVSDLGASTRLHEYEPAARAAQLDEGRRYIDLAHRMQVPYVRVFPDKVPAGQTKPATIARIIAGMRELGEHARGSGVAVILESHGEFTDSPALLEILKGSEMPTTGLLWDAHHTFVAGKEPPGETYRQLGRYVRHTHLKDSRPGEKPGERRYVLTGMGEVPVREQVRVLAASGYRGYYCLEWEKRWHPEIEEPEVALPQYAKVMREYLKDFKVGS